MSFFLTHMTSHSARERNYERDRHYPDKPDKYGEVAPPERITNDFYKHHKFYRILAVERHTMPCDIEARGNLLMRGLDHDSLRYKQLQEAMDCLVNGGGLHRALYDRFGDRQQHDNSYVPEPQREAWRHMRRPEVCLPQDRIVHYTRKRLDILSSMKDARGAASGKLSTHNQFGFASTSNPYLV